MDISGKTRVVGIFGNPVEHSFSPVMHNRAFEFLGLDYCYVPFLVTEENLSSAVQAIKGLNLVGVNVTVPHKEQVMGYLDEISPEAAAAGAVNVVVNIQGKLVGYNTDGAGFYRSLVEESGAGVQGKRVLLLGAGGAARGVGMQLALEGAQKITVINRTMERAADLAEDIDKKTNVRTGAKIFTYENLAEILPETDILINCTSIGMYPKDQTPSPVNMELLSKNLVVCDLVYNPMETSLLKDARKNGARTVSGIGMLLYQGALAFELWTGKKAPLGIMRESLLNYLGHK